MRKYSEDLNSELVWFSNGPKQLSPQIVRYTTHVLNNELVIRYFNGKKFGNQMAFGYQNFYHGR